VCLRVEILLGVRARFFDSWPSPWGPTCPTFLAGHRGVGDTGAARNPEGAAYQSPGQRPGWEEGVLDPEP